MNTNILSTITVIILCFFWHNLNAQDGYTYTLIDNGSYSYTIKAVPNVSANNFITSVQSYGFTIVLPDGITASITSSLGSGANATFFDGSNVGDNAIDGYLITETLGSPTSLVAPSTGMTSNIVTIQINGSPTSGTMYILENNSSLATTVTALKSFMQADMIDNNMAEFVNVVDANASGVSGISSFNFATLSTPENSLQQISIYPNPATDTIHITGIDHINAIEIYNINGQLVQTKNKGLTTLDISNLQAGVYFAKLTIGNVLKTIKFIKK